MFSTFSKRLNYAFDQQGDDGPSQEKVAEYAGVSQASISGWRKGKRTPQIDVAIKIAEFLHVSPNWLICGDSRDETNVDSNIVPVGSFCQENGNVLFKKEKSVGYSAAAHVSKECESFVMSGNHMEPVIRDGDIVVIDTDDKVIKNGAVYAFFANNQFIVAALNRSISGQVSASFFNPKQTEQINGKITIIGRAVKRLTDL